MSTWPLPDDQNSTWPPTEPPADVLLSISENTYLWVYAVLCCSLMVLGVGRVLAFRYGSVRASRVLHTRMFDAVVSARTAFFDTNNVGRVLNRFSRDTDTMDNQMAFVFYDFVQVRVNVLRILEGNRFAGGSQLTVTRSSHWNA
jgi:ATP-binding cassette subfamily C (CFTR/MRP) protein 4